VLRRLAIVAVLVAAIGVAFVTVASGAPRKVYVERDIVSQQLAYRPHAIGLSADGTFAITGIRWQSYGGSAARAKARAYVRGCTPDCAQGRVYRPRATLSLSALVPCRGVTIYSQLRYVLYGPLPAGFHRSGTESLRPLGEENGC